jgi:hypothetical protein
MEKISEQESENLWQGVNMFPHREPWLINIGELKILLYADDIALIADTPEDLEKALKHASMWGDKWRMEFNAKKCGVLKIEQKKRKNEPYNLKFTLQCNKVPHIQHYEYLGTEIEDEMQNTLQHAEIRSKMQVATNKIKSALHSEHLGLRDKFHYIKENIQSHFNYGCIYWCNPAHPSPQQRTVSKDGDNYFGRNIRRAVGCMGNEYIKICILEAGMEFTETRKDIILQKLNTMATHRPSYTRYHQIPCKFSLRHMDM